MPRKNETNRVLQQATAYPWLRDHQGHLVGANGEPIYFMGRTRSSWNTHRHCWIRFSRSKQKSTMADQNLRGLPELSISSNSGFIELKPTCHRSSVRPAAFLEPTM